MTWTDRGTQPIGRGPRLALLIALGCCVLLTLLPRDCLTPVRDFTHRVLKPSQQGVRWICGAWRSQADRLHAGLAGDEQVVALQQRCRALEEENRRLQSAIELADHRLQANGTDSQAASRLLSPCLLPANVLGQQTLGFLARRQLLDVGARAGVEPQAIVTALPRCLLDAGRDRQVEPGRLVLAAGRVWGRIAEVGAYTSVVQTVCQPGYRDVVRLVSPGGNPSRGPRGLLEGNGSELPRIRLVEVTRPVAVGDLVYTAADQGLLPEPLLYGRVARLERPVGGAHWEIWMQSDVEQDPPDAVAVVCVGDNTIRSAQSGKEPAR